MAPRLALLVLAALAAHGCATVPRAVPPLQSLSEFFDPALACDATGNVYIAAVLRLESESRIFFAASSRYGDPWSDAVHYLNTSSRGDRRRPRLAAGDAGEVYVVWEDTRRGPRDLYFNRSLDGGATWLPLDVRVNTNPAGPSHITAPALAWDARGDVYVVWLDDREGFEAYYANRSRDRGETWLQSEVRLTSLTLGRKSLPRALCDPAGDVYVVWVEQRDGQQSIYFSASHDHGETWMPVEERLSTPGGRAWEPDLCLAQPEVLLVTWMEERDGRADVVCTRSTNRGESWDFEPRRFTTGQQPLYDPSSPQAAGDGRNHAYIAWRTSAADGGTRLILKATDDGGRTFTETTVERPYPIGAAAFAALTPSEQRARPFGLAADGAGNVYFTWVEAHGGEAGVGFDRVSNYGRTWQRLGGSPDEPGHPPARADPPRLCADDFGHVHLLWNEGPALHAATSPFYGDSGWRYRHF